MNIGMKQKEESLVIKAAGPKDAKLLSALGTVTFYEAYFEQDSPEDIAGYLAEHFTLERMSADLADADTDFFICYRKGKAVGYAKLLQGSEAEGTAPNSIELERIYTVERVWGTGVGTALLTHCMSEARARGFSHIWLGVWERNLRALAFYRKHGFERVGTVTYPYGDSVGINQVMQRKL